MSFYSAVSVRDPDDLEKQFTFDLADTSHGACFNIGLGRDGSPIISWSDLHALYELPDGTKWAEHGFFHDAEDMVRLPEEHIGALLEMVVRDFSTDTEGLLRTVLTGDSYLCTAMTNLATSPS